MKFTLLVETDEHRLRGKRNDCWKFLSWWWIISSIFKL